MSGSLFTQLFWGMLPTKSYTGPSVLSGLNTSLNTSGVFPSEKASRFSSQLLGLGSLGNFCPQAGHWVGLVLSCLLPTCSLHSTSNPSFYFCIIKMPSGSLPALLPPTYSTILPVSTCADLPFVPSLLWEMTSVSHSLGVKATCPSQPPPGCPGLPRAALPRPPGNTRPRDCIMHTFRLQVPHGRGLCCLSWLHLFH